MAGGEPDPKEIVFPGEVFVAVKTKIVAWLAAAVGKYSAPRGHQLPIAGRQKKPPRRAIAPKMPIRSKGQESSLVTAGRESRREQSCSEEGDSRQTDRRMPTLFLTFPTSISVLPRKP